jgi:hypothetical protein
MLVAVAVALILHQVLEQLELVVLVVAGMDLMLQLLWVQVELKTQVQAEAVVHQMAHRQVLAQAVQA